MLIDEETANLRVYIAGPMTGLPEFNFPAFDAAEAMLIKTGFRWVFNPAIIGRIYGMDKSHSFYMKKAIERLITCDAIILLPGWEASKGARLECQIARMLRFVELQYPVPTAQLSQPHGSEAAKNQEGNSHATGTTRSDRNLPIPNASALASLIIRERWNDKLNR